MRRMRLWITVFCAAALAAGGCTGPAEDTILDKDILLIGVRTDLPGLSYRDHDETGDLQGFEVDMAAAIARELGVEYRLIRISADDRESALNSGRVDLTIASHSITQDRKQEVMFAGPYVLEYFNIMVRAGDESIDGVHDLEGKKVCRVGGANVTQRIRDEYGVEVVEFPVNGYTECMGNLADGSIAAISTDELILAGLASSRPDLDLELLDARYSQERIGVGLRKGETAACEEINRAITELYRDGTIEELLQEWFEDTGVDVTDPPVPQFEGCE